MINNISDFCQFSAKKFAFFSKTNVMILQKTSCSEKKKRHFFRQIFRRIIFKIITSVPGNRIMAYLASLPLLETLPKSSRRNHVQFEKMVYFFYFLPGGDFTATKMSNLSLTMVPYAKIFKNLTQKSLTMEPYAKDAIVIFVELHMAIEVPLVTSFTWKKNPSFCKAYVTQQQQGKFYNTRFLSAPSWLPDFSWFKHTKM
jgi:hypothetical protein